MKRVILIPFLLLSCTKFTGKGVKSSSPKMVMKDGFQAQAFSGSCTSKQVLIDENVSIKDGKILFSKTREDCKQKMSFDLKFMSDDILILSNPKFVEPCKADVQKVSALTRQYFKVKIMDSNILQFQPMMGGHCRSLKIAKYER